MSVCPTSVDIEEPVSNSQICAALGSTEELAKGSMAEPVMNQATLQRRLVTS